MAGRGVKRTSPRLSLETSPTASAQTRAMSGETATGPQRIIPLALCNCSICWEPVIAAPDGPENEVAELRPCEHSFHAGCVVTWLSRQNTCPECRTRCNWRWSRSTGLVALPDVDVPRKEMESLYSQYEDVSCQYCGSQHDDGVLLLCDGCDRGFHTYCVGLSHVPDGDWLCPCCIRDSDGEVGIVEAEGGGAWRAAVQHALRASAPVRAGPRGGGGGVQLLRTPQEKEESHQQQQQSQRRSRRLQIVEAEGSGRKRRGKRRQLLSSGDEGAML